MVYSPEEKKLMDDLLLAFEQHIMVDEHYDILYSPKIGFIKLILEEDEPFYFRIKGFDDLLDMIIYDYILVEELEAETYLGTDYDHLRKQLVPILCTLDNREHCLTYLEEAIEQHRIRREKSYPEYLEEERIMNELIAPMLEDAKRQNISFLSYIAE